MRLIIRKGIILAFLLLILNPLFLLADIEIQTSNSTSVKDSDNIVFNKYQVVDSFIASSTSTTIEICSCSHYKDTIRLYNTGTIANKYAIRASKDYAVPSERVVSLKPGEEKEVSIFITAPCKEGTQEIEYAISTSTQKTKVIEKKLVTGYCSSFAVKPTVSGMHSDPCELQVFEAEIFNVGNFKDDYILSVDSFEDSIRFSESTIPIAPNRNKTAFIYFEPDCSVYGINNITLSVESKKTGLQSDIGLISNISRSYEYFVQIPNELDQCNMRYEERQFTITNIAKIKNIYKISVEGPEWISILDEEITLDSLETKNVDIILAPILENIEDVTFNVTIEGVLGDIRKEYEVSVKINDCYSYEIQNQYDGPLLLCSDDKELLFKINNKGSEDNFYNVNSYSKERGFLSAISIFSKEDSISSISENSIFVPSEDLREVYVGLNLSDEEKKYDIYFNAQTFSEAFNNTQKQRIHVITSQECYDVNTNLASKYRFNRSINSISINISSNGLKPGIYNIGVPDAEWVSLDKSAVNLESKGSDLVTITFNPNDEVPDDTYNLNLELSLEGKYYRSLEFEVEIINETFWQKIRRMIDEYKQSKEEKKIEKNSYDFEIIPQYEKTLLFCSDDKEIYFEINNKGSENNIYTISAQSNKKGISPMDLFDKERPIIEDIRYPSVYVENKSRKKVYVELDVPDENDDYEVLLNAQTFSEEYNMTAKQDVSIVSKQDCYQAKTSLKSRYVINRAKNSILFDIENTGLKETDYSISIPGFEWIELDKKNMTLEPGEIEDIVITLDPNDEVPDNTYNVNLQINSDGRFHKIEEFNIKVRTKTFWQKLFDFMTSFRFNKVNESEQIEDLEEINYSGIGQDGKDTDDKNESSIENHKEDIDDTASNDSFDDHTIRTTYLKNIYEVCVVYNKTDAIEQYDRESLVEITEDISPSQLEEICSQVEDNDSQNSSRVASKAQPESQNDSFYEDTNSTINQNDTIFASSMNSSMIPGFDSQEEVNQFAKKMAFILIGALICLIIILSIYIIFVLVRSKVNDDGYYYSEDVLQEEKRAKKPRKKTSKKKIRK